MKPPRHLALLCLLVLAATVPLRGQLTESPQPIGPGSFLFEIDGLRLAFDRDAAAGERHAAIGVASTVVSAGLTQAVDLQIGVDIFLRERIKSDGARESHSGFGDVSLRAKWAFWQDESGGAAALIPYVRMPTGTGGMGSDSAEGGFILPWETRVAGGLTTGAMLQWDMVRNPDDDGFDTVWLLSGYLHRNITTALGLYAEAALETDSTGGSGGSGIAGVGAVWTLNARISLDYELLRGINRRATDWTHVFRVNWSW
jgi:hypothetical protein